MRTICICSKSDVLASESGAGRVVYARLQEGVRISQDSDHQSDALYIWGGQCVQCVHMGRSVISLKYFV